jgi:hypothetical protein
MAGWDMVPDDEPGYREEPTEEEQREFERDYRYDFMAQIRSYYTSNNRLPALFYNPERPDFVPYTIEIINEQRNDPTILGYIRQVNRAIESELLKLLPGNDRLDRLVDNWRKNSGEKAMPRKTDTLNIEKLLGPIPKHESAYEEFEQATRNTPFSTASKKVIAKRLFEHQPARTLIDGYFESSELKTASDEFIIYTHKWSKLHIKKLEPLLDKDLLSEDNFTVEKFQTASHNRLESFISHYNNHYDEWDELIKDDDINSEGNERYQGYKNIVQYLNNMLLYRRSYAELVKRNIPITELEKESPKEQFQEIGNDLAINLMDIAPDNKGEEEKIKELEKSLHNLKLENESLNVTLSNWKNENAEKKRLIKELKIKITKLEEQVRMIPQEADIDLKL